MLTEKSCGAVIFTEDDGDIKYLIICSKEGIYGFPKGHVEGMESETETALREIAEETGLSVSLIDGFRTVDSYTFERDDREIFKHVVYFLAEYSNQVPTVQESELRSVHLMDFDSAIEVFQFEDLKRILTEAHTFLINYCYN